MTSVSARMFRVSAIAIGAGFVLPTPTIAAGYIYFRDSPVVGEVAGDKNGGKIEIDSWSWGEYLPASSGTMTMKGSKIGQNMRETKPSSQRAGTEDINIGVGELQEVTISKSMDTAPPKPPAQRPMTLDNSTQKIGVGRATPLAKGSFRVKTKTPWLACRVGARYPLVELGDGNRAYKLWDVTVASCGGDADDRPTEEIAFYYNKIS